MWYTECHLYLFLDGIRIRYIPFTYCLYLHILGYPSSSTIYLTSTDSVEDARVTNDVWRLVQTFYKFQVHLTLTTFNDYNML